MAQTRPKAKRRRTTFTPEEGRAHFDEQARRLLGMEGEEFVRRWEAGEFDDNPDRRGVIELSIVLPLYYDSLP